MEALEYLRDAKKNSEDSVAATALLALAYAFTGRYPDWSDCAYELAQMPPRTAEDCLLKAQAIMVVVDPEGAFKLAEEAMERRPTPLSLAVRAECRAWLAIHKASHTDAMFAVDDARAARKLLRDHRYVLQASLFTHIVAMILADPDIPSITGLREEADEIAMLL